MEKKEDNGIRIIVQTESHSGTKIQKMNLFIESEQDDFVSVADYRVTSKDFAFHIKNWPVAAGLTALIKEVIDEYVVQQRRR